MGTRESIVRAMQEGAEAGRRGDPPTVCPYSDLRRTAWLQGYVRTAPPRPPVEDDDA
ncbi:Rmf/CrpP fold protein [Streptomyces sp. NPDC016675]|uniref:Rmf/CrpP fold protein n=1 Tax=Streptomyces sp. NPDC016675 TaxID=3364970 RepID=UPI0036FC5E92